MAAYSQPPTKQATFNVHFTMKNTLIKTFGFISLVMIATNIYSQATPSGSETIVNTTTTNDQQRPEVAVAPNGDYVVVWQSEDEDGMDNGIYWQMYTAGGVPNGGPVKANVTTNYGQKDPDVAIAADGSFVISWSSQFEDTDGWGVWFALYDNTGTLIQRNRVNDSSADEQIHSCVAMRYDGYFVVGYMDDGQDGDNFGISYQGFSNAGVAQFAERVPNSTTTGWQGHPDVAMDSAGNYTFVWQDYALDGSDAGIFMQRYDKNDNTVGSQTQVNTTTAGNQINPSIEMDNDGNFMIAWSSFGQDGDHFGIVSQIYDNSGSAVGGEIDVNTTTAGSQDYPSVSVSSYNTYLVSWTSWGQDGDKAGVYMQGYLADGTVFGVEQIVNTTTSGYQALPSVSGDEDTDEAVVVWQSGAHHTASTQDGDGYGVYQQRFLTSDLIDPVANCQNINVYLDGAGNASITGNDIDNGSTDNVGITTYTPSVSSFTCSEIGANAVTLTVADAAGNTDNCASTVTVLDTVSPTASCQNITVYLDGTGNATITAADIDNGSTDNCTTVSLSADITAFTCADVGANTVTLTVTDGSANTSTCTSTVTVNDTVSPTASCQNITVYLDGAGNATITAADIDNGSTDNCSTVSLSADITAFTCAEAGANTVTLTVTDGSANTSTCTSTVTVLDTISPIASCQNINAYLDGAGNVTIAAADIDNGSTDNCSTVSLSADITAFTCVDAGANTVTLTVTDGASNTSTCTSTVTVLDTVSPTASCQNITVYLDGAGNTTITAADIDNGSTDNCGSVTLSANITAFTCADAGANTVTLTVTDGSANTSTCTSTVTVLDTISPTASCQNINAYLDGTGNVTITTADIDNGSTDNCSTVSLSADITAFTCADIGANTVTLTVTDGNANTSTCTSTVTVADTTSPTASCQNITVYLDGTGNTTITAADIDNGSTDNCSTVSLSADITAFTCAEAGANTVTLTVTDGSSNTSTCTSTVTVLDTISPVADIASLSDVTAECSVTSLTDPTATDNCGGTVTVTNDATLPISGEGTTVITWTYDDGNGNTSTQTQNVIIDDITAPVADVASLSDVTAECSVTSLTDPTATDNCGGSVTVTNDATLPISGEGTTTVVTWTYDDGNGNTSTQTQNVIIDDITAPVVTCPSDQTESPDVNCQFTLIDYTGLVTLTDNCSASSTITQSPIAGTVITGSTAIWMYADDGNGNVDSCTFNVILNDITPPTAVCQDIDTYLNITGISTISVVDLDGGSSDNCAGLSFGATQTAFTCSDLGVNIITLTVTDGNSNTATCSSNVTVIDTLVPVPDLVSLSDVNGECNVTPTTPTATDNCGGTLTATTTDPTSYSAEGSYVITWTYDDGNGNTSTQTQNVIVDDITSPVVTCPGNQFENPNANCEFTLVDYTSLASITDNCSTTSTIMQSPAVGTVITGTTTIWMFGDDGNGNLDSCSFDVILNDLTAPTAICQDVDTYLDITGNATINDVDLDGGSTDNCTGLSFSANQSSFTCVDLGTNTITLTVTDGNSNIATCSAIVTVIDTIAPIADVAILPNATGQCNVSVTPPTATDNCSTVITGTTTDPTTYPTEGSYLITWTFDDGNGNTSTQTQNVYLDDYTPPVLTCPGDQTETPSANCEFTLVDYTSLATITDNCSTSSTVTQSPSVGTVITGNTTIWLIGNDGNGNTDSCSFDVILVDTEAPIAVCQNVDLYLDILGNITLLDSDLDGGSTDNCTGLSFSAAQTSFTCVDLGTNTIVLTVTDGNSNATTCSSDVTIIDTISPVADISLLTDITGECNVAVTAPTATDVCSGIITGTTSDPTTYPTEGSYLITWTYDDGNGNTLTQTQNVIVDDITAPVVTCPGNQTETPSANCEFTLVDYTSLASITDNCSTTSTIVQSPVAGTMITGTTTIWMIGDDGNGNIDSCSFNVILVDTEAPIAVCQDIDTYLDITGSATINDADLDGGSTDNCTGLIFSADQSSFTCVDLGTNTITLTITDGNSNTATCSSNVTVIDTIAPVAVIDTLSNITSECSVTSLVDPTATDNCTGIITVTNDASLPISGEGTTTVVTWTYDDGNGNTSSQTQNVIIDDITSPVVTCPGDQTETPVANCEFTLPDYTGLASITDNCSTTSTIIQSPTAGTTITGTTTLWMIGDDGNGNIDSCSFDVILLDFVAPTAICQDASIYMDSLGSAILNADDLDGGSTDNCSGLSFAASQSLFSCSEIGSNVITLTVTDGNSNTATCSSIVTVIDTIAPLVDIDTLTAFGECSITVTPPTATDNCTGLITGTTTDPLIYTVQGTYTINWTYVDGNGNLTNQTQEVTVNDTTAPVVTCPGDQTEAPIANCEFTMFDYTGLASATDNCSTTTTITQSPAPGTVINGNQVVWMIADDGLGNLDSCSFTVILEDFISPTAVCQDATFYLDTLGVITINGSDLDGGSTDNCMGLTLTASVTNFTCFDIGTMDVTLTATDGSGNFDNCVASVTILDTLAPVPDSLMLADATSECNVTLIAPTATDNCTGVITGITNDPISYSTEGTYLVTWEYTDAQGNTSSQTQNVIIDDTTAPLITCVADTSYQIATGSCDTTVIGLTPTGITDNCSSSPTLTYTLAGATTGSGSGSVDGATFTGGVTTVTYTVDDGNGNTTSCNFDVTVIDNEVPTVSCAGDIDVALNDSCTFILLDYTSTAVTSDNCTLTITQTPAIGTSITSATVVTLTATDPSGNADSCSFTITPTDMTAPSITCLSDETIYLDENCEVTLTDYTQLVSTSDNCGGTVTVTQSPAAGEIYTVSGTMEVILYAEDLVGNIDSCSFILTIDVDATSGCQQSLIISDLLTPNGDGENDTWKIKETSFIEGCTVTIYNRWGKKLYETTSYQNEWDGTKDGKNLPDGAYFYVIECDGEVAYKGPVTLMRLAK